ncbi:MAG: AsmA-like C-terminal region-containing protein [Bacteroides sp.]|nr:AsmA-like C-terminal region-containing protein [Bacteroides sp.]
MTQSPAARIARIALISIGGLLAVVLLVVGIAVAVVLSPKRLTPLVNRIATQSLCAEVQVCEVDLTFFSSFPHMGLALKDGSVVSHSFRDTASAPEDTLFAFHRCWVGLNLRTYVRHKKLSFFAIELDSADCRLFTRADGVANYHIFSTQDTFSSNVSALQLPDIEVNRFRIDHVNVHFRDQRTGTEARIRKLALAGEGAGDTADLRASVNFEIADIDFTQVGQKMVKGIPLQGSLQVSYNCRDRKGTLWESRLQVKRLEVGVQGGFEMDTAGGIGMDMKADLQTASLQEVLDMLPQKYLKAQGVQADGQIDMHGRIYGCFGGGEMPEADLRLNLENGHVHYPGMPYPVDTLRVQLNAHLAPGKKTPSYVDIEELGAVAKDMEVISECMLSDLFTDPSVDFKLSADVDLAVLPEIFPLRNGLAMRGVVAADMDGRFRLSYIRNANYGKVQARGKFDMADVFFNDTLSGIYWNTDAQCRFKGGKYLGGVVLLNKLHGTLPGVNVRVDSLEVKAISQALAGRSETSIVPMACALRYARLFAAVGDSLQVFSVASVVKGKVVPVRENARDPLVTIDFKTDSLFVRRADYRVRIRRATLRIRLTRLAPSSWWPAVEANLQRVAVTLPQLSEPLQIQRFGGTLDGRDLEIDQARFRLGESRLAVRGKVWDVPAIIHRQGFIKADLRVESRMIDCNQLLNILNRPVDTVQLEERAGACLADMRGNEDMGAAYQADSLRQSVLLRVPGNLDLRVDVEAQKVYYDRTAFDSIHGKIQVRNRAVNLREFSMQAWGADMSMNLVYAGRSRQQADIGADISLNGIRVDSLLRGFSALDTTLPMLRSFEGRVDLQATASAQLDSNVNIRLPSLTAALHLHGDSLVLLDGEAFARIAKMLMFKNRKRNLIDSVSAVIAVQDGKITVYPFVLEIDRYKAAVGGWQDMEMNYRYHVSLLDAPVLKGLTRGGITMHGNFNDSKLPWPKFGHPLYKDAATPAFVRQIDEARLALGRQIMLQFEGWMNRERRRLPAVSFPKVEIAIDSLSEAEKDCLTDTIR